MSKHLNWGELRQRLYKRSPDDPGRRLLVLYQEMSKWRIEGHQGFPGDPMLDDLLAGINEVIRLRLEMGHLTERARDYASALNSQRLNVERLKAELRRVNGERDEFRRQLIEIDADKFFAQFPGGDQ